MSNGQPCRRAKYSVLMGNHLCFLEVFFLHHFMEVFSSHQAVKEHRVSLSFSCLTSRLHNLEIKKSEMTWCDVLVLVWPCKQISPIQARIAKETT